MRTLLALAFVALAAAPAAAQSGRVIKGESGDAANVDANGNLMISIGQSDAITYRYSSLDDAFIAANIPSAQIGTAQGAANGVTPQGSGIQRLYVMGWCSSGAPLAGSTARVQGWRLIQKIRIVSNDGFVEGTGANAISKSQDSEPTWSGQVNISDASVGALGTNGPLMDGVAMTNPENSGAGTADYGGSLFCRDYYKSRQVKVPIWVAQSGFMTFEYIAPSGPGLWSDIQFFVTIIAVPSGTPQ